MEDLEFAPWYEREHPWVQGGLCALSGELDAAREATDEAFVRALQPMESSRQDGIAGEPMDISSRAHRVASIARAAGVATRDAVPRLTGIGTGDR